jgi:hypothetical protein
MINKNYLLALFVGLSFYLLGVVDGKLRLFYPVVKDVISAVGLPLPKFQFLSKQIDVLKYDGFTSEDEIQQLVRINDISDVEKYKNMLKQVVFGNNGFNKDYSILYSHKNTYMDGVEFLSITIGMRNSINSVLSVYIPDNNNNRLVIYYHGHPDSYVDNDEAMKKIDFLIKKGFIIMAVNLPLQGENSRPIVSINNVGKIEFTSHNHFKFLDNPLSYFLFPIFKGIDELNDKLNYNFEDISIIGLSGGASMATLATALDERIMYSYAVSPQYPIFLTSLNDQDYGDYESTYPDLVTKIGYLNVYILASLGKKRRYTQIFNLLDGDYSGGLKFKAYEDVVKSEVNRLSKLGFGGYFNIISDESHRGHKISEYAIGEIYRDMVVHPKIHISDFR